jgi:hypothetical protein
MPYDYPYSPGVIVPEDPSINYWAACHDCVWTGEPFLNPEMADYQGQEHEGNDPGHRRKIVRTD